MGEGQSALAQRDPMTSSFLEAQLAAGHKALQAGLALEDPSTGGVDPQLCEPALLSQLVLLLGSRPRRSLLLSDLGALLPANLRQGVKDKGGLRSWLQKYPELFQVSGLPGKESVTLLILGGSAGNGPNGEAGLPAPVGPQNASVAELEAAKRQEEEDNEAAIQLRGLPYRATMQDVKNFLQHHAYNLKNDPNAIQLVLNRDGRPSGFGRVQFRTPEQARRCRDELHMRVMEVAGAGGNERDRGDRYVEIFLYSERPNKLRFKKATGDAYDQSQDEEIEALGVTRQKVLEECRQHMSMPGKSPLLLSMLGVALSPGSRLYLKKTDQGLKHFLASHPSEFLVDGSKGREIITYLPGAGAAKEAQALPALLREEPTPAPALPKATLEVPKAQASLPLPSPESPKAIGGRFAPNSPLPPGSVGSNCGHLGTRRGSDSAGPATGNLSDLGGFPPTPGWDDLVPQSPKASVSNLPPTDETPICTNHPGMQTPSDWGTPWDIRQPRLDNRLGNFIEPGVGASTGPASGVTGPVPETAAAGANMFQPWSAWGMPPAFWTGAPPSFGPPTADVSQEALQNLLAFGAGGTAPAPDPAASMQVLLNYVAMGGAPPGPLPAHGTSWMDMATGPGHQMPAAAPEAPKKDIVQQLIDQDIPIPGQQQPPAPQEAKLEASQAPAAVRLRGLPYEAGEQDILAWMAKYDVVERIMECKQAVRIYSKNNGKPMGLAVVALNSEEDAEYVRRALHGQFMGNRYIEVFIHTEGEAGTDKAMVQGSTAAATGGTGACNGEAQARPETRAEADQFIGAGDTGGSGGSGVPPQGMLTGMPLWPGAASMGCMPVGMPFTGGELQSDPHFQNIMDFLKGDAYPMQMAPPMGDGSAGLASGYPRGSGRSSVRIDSM
mmetsp:Transcript_22352/g.51829  ORF Transcript_22352/g.51829 Transcript_22352/m.51829 type:complete len:892 (-) Transcript_22352:49-2724(-)